MTDARSLRLQLQHFGRALQLVWSSAPGIVTVWAVLLFSRGVVPVATVQLVRHLVDRLVELRATGTLPAGPLLLLAALAGLLIAGEVLRVADTWVRSRLAERVGDRITDQVQSTSTSVDLSFYESSDYHNRLYRVLSDGRTRPMSLLEALGSLLQGAVTLLGLTALLVRFSFWLPAALLVSTLPALWVMLQHSLRQHQWQCSVTERERAAAYCEGLLSNAGTAAEVRMFGVADFFQQRFRDLRNGLRAERMALQKSQLAGDLGTALLGHTVAGVAVGVMVLRALRGEVTLGEVALFYQAFSLGQGALRTIADQFRGIYSHTLFLADLFEFVALKPRVCDPPEPLPAPSAVEQAITFDRVSFRYPESERLALSDLTLSLPAGKITAIVGPNGSGKSTLLKLLCRLYDPTEGHVRVDGTDLCRFRVSDLRKLLTVLFQVPVQYADTVRTNIRVGDMNQDSASPAIQEAAVQAGAEAIIGRLPHGYETRLVQCFGGTTDLSTGEWQRLGLARAFLRRAPIIVLDEPTSAMDPWAEAEWLDRFRRLAQGRTVLIITHRFTTAMKADTIHVLERGSLMESGTHQELLERGGRYAESWQRQVQTWSGDGSIERPAAGEFAHHG